MLAFIAIYRRGGAALTVQKDGANVQQYSRPTGRDRQEKARMEQVVADYRYYHYAFLGRSRGAGDARPGHGAVPSGHYRGACSSSAAEDDDRPL